MSTSRRHGISPRFAQTFGSHEERGRLVKQLKHTTSALLTLILTLVLLLTHCATDTDEPIDLKSLRNSGDDWTVRQDTLPDGSVIRLHHESG